MEVLEGRGGLQATGVDVLADVAWRPGVDILADVAWRPGLWQRQGWGEGDGGREGGVRNPGWPPGSGAKAAGERGVPCASGEDRQEQERGGIQACAQGAGAGGGPRF